MVRKIQIARRCALIATTLALCVAATACGDDDNTAGGTAGAGAASASAAGTTSAATPGSAASTVGGSTASTAGGTAGKGSATKSGTLDIVTVASLTGPNQANSIPLAAWDRARREGHQRWWRSHRRRHRVHAEGDDERQWG